MLRPGGRELRLIGGLKVWSSALGKRYGQRAGVDGGSRTVRGIDGHEGATLRFENLLAGESWVLRSGGCVVGSLIW